MGNKLVGKQMVDFKNDRGEAIQGIKLHFLCKDDRVDGEMAATQFINVTSSLYEVALNMAFGEFDFVYGPKGRIMDITLPVGK